MISQEIFALTLNVQDARLMKTALSVVRIVPQRALKDVQIVQEAVPINAVLALRGTLF
jgi:hypothetical protein